MVGGADGGVNRFAGFIVMFVADAGFEGFARFKFDPIESGAAFVSGPGDLSIRRLGLTQGEVIGAD